MKTSSTVRKTKKTVHTLTWVGCAVWLARNLVKNHKKNRYTTEPLPQAEAL